MSLDWYGLYRYHPFLTSIRSLLWFICAVSADGSLWVESEGYLSSANAVNDKRETDSELYPGLQKIGSKNFFLQKFNWNNAENAYLYLKQQKNNIKIAG